MKKYEDSEVDKMTADEALAALKRCMQEAADDEDAED
jgi:hypothetical protein